MTSTDVWIAPRNPDPSAILHEAVHDAKAGRYDIALAKHVWYHQYALVHEESLAGVRLSFALGYWRDLGKEYPPALIALRHTRDQAESAFLKGLRFEDFHDLARINKTLGETHRTVETFKLIAQSDRQGASAVYHVAERALIGAKEFKLCGEYVKPKQTLDLAIRLFHLAEKRRSERAESDPRLPENAYEYLIQNMATLVGILVVNDRLEEAQAIADEAQAALPGYPIKASLAPALAGQLPPVRP